MKKLSTLFSSILFAGLMVLLTTSAYAQPFCGANGVDPDVSTSTDPLGQTITNFIPGQYLAQSFVANQPNTTGASIVVPPGFSGTFTISLIEGLPSAPGATLVSGSVTTAGGESATANWPITDVVVGNDYHLLFESTDLTLAFYSTTTINPVFDEYPGGSYWLGAFPIVFALPFDLYFEVEYCADVIVPTMGQWGLILLSFLLLSFGTVQVLRRQTVLSGATGTSSNIKVPALGSIPFMLDVYTRALMISALLYTVVFGVAMAGFGYEWMQADFAGILMTMPVLAYLIHLLIAKKEA
ncbi:MAG: IPTL-CTERM sorting domain-containing protein [Bacteroidota bacterium]